jgi:hypothetical protein
MIEPNPYSERDIKDLLHNLKIRIDKINPLVRDINAIFSQIDCAINWDKKVQEMKIQDIINGQNVNWFDNKTTATEHLDYMRKFIYGNPETWENEFMCNPTPKEDK